LSDNLELTSKTLGWK